MQKISVMIVDDHEVVREGLKQLLSLIDNIEIVAEASSGLECIELLENCVPDIVFMDIRMPGINGIETTRLVCQKYSQVKVIMLTIYDDDQYITDAIEAGAKGYVLKKVTSAELNKVVHDVMEHGVFLDPAIAESIFRSIRKKERPLKGEKRAALTVRELEVLKYLVEGYTDRHIGDSLCISEYTVRSHIKSIYKKLMVSSKSQAVAKALHQGIIKKGN